MISMAGAAGRAARARRLPHTAPLRTAGARAPRR